MPSRGAQLMVALLILGVTAAGCAKRPATTQVSAAPPPTGAAATTSGSTTAVPTPPSSSSATATPTPSGTGSSGAGATTPPASTTRPSPKEFVAVADLKDVFFDFDKYDVRPGDAKILDANAAWLKSNDNLVLIEGHCDERGTNEYNLALGERRAKSTMNYLVSQGIQASRITIISYGEERPVCTEKSEDCWAKNRRAHFLVKPR
jgi:peptidoglycan-associated lipoprotein